MKKLLTAFALLSLTVLCASCGDKLCYCYESTSGGVYESEAYVYDDSPCSSMNTDTRGCVERSERMDPTDVAYK